jgi:hypothetical protein
MAREGVPLPVIQRQLGHAHLGVTSTYLQGIDTTELSGCRCYLDSVEKSLLRAMSLGFGSG